MSRPRNHPQVYVAIPVPEPVVRQWLAALEGLSCPSGATVHPHGAILTVQYLGSIAVRDLEAVEESVRRAAAGFSPFELVPRALVTLPADGPARQIAALTDAPSPLIELKDRLVRRLARKTRRPKEEFEPRVPLLRFTAPVADFTLQVTVPPVAFLVDRIQLMETRISTQGPFQQVLLTTALEA